MLDIKDRFKKLFCKLFRLLHIAKSKSSTAGHRSELEVGIPNVMTKLEISLPVDWNAPCIHFFVCTTLETMLDCGTFVYDWRRERTFGVYLCTF